MNSPFLWELLSQPTAPFREAQVIARAARELELNKVPHFLDPAGNLVVGAASKSDLQKQLKLKSKEPVRVYMAHMDHPGFHGTEWIDTDRLAIKWHGGSPVDHLENAAVWLSDGNGFTHLQGRLARVRMNEKGRPAIDTAEVVFANVDPRSHFPEAKNLYGGLCFRAPVWEENGRLYTKAADDLIGVYAIVMTAISLWKDTKRRKLRPNFLGLLTRAEEVGFIGAIEHFKLGWLAKSKRPVVVVSLETSRTLPGAEFGKGPVVRLGDRTTVFNPGALQILTEAALSALPGKHQRRIMDGGSCEATAATAFGMTAIGISIPLGNYHNQCFEGGPDASGPNGPAPEFVELSDIEGMVTLCEELLKTGFAWSEPWKSKSKDLESLARQYQPLMKSGLPHRA